MESVQRSCGHDAWRWDVLGGSQQHLALYRRYTRSPGDGATRWRGCRRRADGRSSLSLRDSPTCRPAVSRSENPEAQDASRQCEEPDEHQESAAVTHANRMPDRRHAERQIWRSTLIDVRR
jgi:hypothetical protein